MSFGEPGWAVSNLWQPRECIACSLVCSQTFNEGKSWVLGEEESIRVLKAAWDIGINTIDTSNNYSNGASERIIAKFLERVCSRSIMRGRAYTYALSSTTSPATRWSSRRSATVGVFLETSRHESLTALQTSSAATPTSSP